MEAILLE